MTRNCDRNFTTGRILLDFQPSDGARFSLNLNGLVDKSDGQAAQLINPARLGPLATYPIAPRDHRDADWTPEQKPKRDDWFYQAAFRGDIDLTDDLTLTSITSWSEYHNVQDIDPDGVALRDYFYNSTGKITALSQELGLQGRTGGLTYILEHRAEKWEPVFRLKRCENKKLEPATCIGFNAARSRRQLCAGENLPAG